MTSYVLKRLMHIVPVLIATTLLVFWLLSLSPSDPAQLILGLGAEPEQLEMMRDQLGLNDPLIVRYARYMGGVLTGDFGTSYSTRRPVAELIGVRLPNTLILAFGSLVLVLAVAIPLGVALAVRQNSLFDNVMRVVTLLTAAMPSFWLGLMLILLFSVRLGWLPSSGLDNVKAAIMPLICLSVAGWTVTSRLTRASMLDVVRQDYIRTARAKGVNEAKVIAKHALRNALIPVITYVGPMTAYTLTGSMVVETVFTIGGLGAKFVTGINNRDYPMIMATTIFLAALMVVMTLLSDLLYKAVDPKIDFS